MIEQQVEVAEAVQHVETFKKRRTLQWIVSAPMIALVVGLTWFRDHPRENLYGVSADKFAIVFLVSLVAAFVFTLKNWRCPACNGYLGRAMNPKHCGNCGAQLR